jgi:hypothetical protein
MCTIFNNFKLSEPNFRISRLLWVESSTTEVFPSNWNSLVYASSTMGYEIGFKKGCIYQKSKGIPLAMAAQGTLTNPPRNFPYNRGGGKI